MSSAQSLVCRNCGHQNELQRVYCHNCGEKLDRSVIPKENTQKKQERAAKEIRKQLKPGAPFFRTHVWPWVSTVLAAAITASLINIFTPAKTPPPVADALRLAPPQLGVQIGNLAFSPAASKVGIESDLVTAYVDGQVRSKPTPGLGYTLEHDRTAIEFYKGFARLHLIKKISWGFGESTGATAKDRPASPFAISGDYSLELVEGRLKTKLLGARIGRLAIHPALASPIETTLFGEFGRIFSKDVPTLEKLGKLTFEEKKVVLETKTATR